MPRGFTRKRAKYGRGGPDARAAGLNYPQRAPTRARCCTVTSLASQSATPLSPAEIASLGAKIAAWQAKLEEVLAPPNIRANSPVISTAAKIRLFTVDDIRVESPTRVRSYRMVATKNVGMTCNCKSCRLQTLSRRDYFSVFFGRRRAARCFVAATASRRRYELPSECTTSARWQRRSISVTRHGALSKI